MKQPRYPTRGFTLIELLAALTAASILFLALGALWQFFHRNAPSPQMPHAATALLRHDLTHTLQTCPQTTQWHNHANLPVWQHPRHAPIQIQSNLSLPDFQAASPILLIWQQSEVLPIRITTQQIIATQNSLPTQESIYLLHRCGQAHLFRATAQNQALSLPKNFSHDLAHEQAAQWSLQRLQLNAYAIGKQGNHQGLFRFKSKHDGTWQAGQLLDENIQHWQIETQSCQNKITFLRIVLQLQNSQQHKLPEFLIQSHFAHEAC